jgi:hypothetical protein
VISSFVPAGRVGLISLISLRASLATETVLDSRDRVIDRLTFGRPLRRLWLSTSAKPSSTLAICPRRTIRSPSRLTTMFSNSRGDSMRPTRRMLCSSSAPLTRPTGAVVFCMRSAFTTSATETLNSLSFSARSSTESSRRSAPSTSTTATPSTPLKRSASSSSASREISAWVSVSEESARVRMGSACGSMRTSTGSRISSGSLWRTEAMALRISSEASTMFFLKLKMITTCARLSEAVERIW